MNIFGSNPEEEKREIIEDTLDLYNDMIEKSFEEQKQSHSGYERTYKKILYNLRNYYSQDILGQGVPQFLTGLINEIEDPRMLMSSTKINMVKMGLKKIARKLEIKLPEKSKSKERKIIPPSINNINLLQANISNETKIELKKTIQEFEKEITKPNPSLSKLKTFFDIIKKILVWI